MQKDLRLLMFSSEMDQRMNGYRYTTCLAVAESEMSDREGMKTQRSTLHNIQSRLCSVSESSFTRCATLVTSAPPSKVNNVSHVSLRLGPVGFPCRL